MTRDKRLHWQKADTLLILLVTALYSVLAFVNLGSTRAPQTYWQTTGYDESVVLDLGEYRENCTMLYYCFVSYEDFDVSVSRDGENWSEPVQADMNQGMCYQWKYLGGGSTYAETERLSGRYVRIAPNQIGLRLGEVIFRETETRMADGTDEDGNPCQIMTERSGARIPFTVLSHTGGNPDSPNYSEGGRIADEQDSLAGEPGWFNSTYFDEIYHARTAYEHLHGEAAYETSHPPLGKLLMSASVAVFGMTPFGWRFAGTLVGVLMLPAVYLLVKQLTKKTFPAALAMGLLALDCMHFTQTRIATIDSFPVLFILLSLLFMLRFMQSDPGDGDWSGLWEPTSDLALSGFFMGCGIASKWIVFYAGAGLAVCYFWTLFRRLREARRRASPQDPECMKRAWSRAFFLCCWCILFFILIPAVIYLTCYVPFFARDIGSGSIRNTEEFLDRWYSVQKYSMFDYHSKPGLGMDHPYYSPWYEWPLSLRPMYYYSAAYMPEGMSQSIYCFGNPAVWYLGDLAMLVTAGCWILGHRYRAKHSDRLWHLQAHTEPGSEGIAAFLLIGFLSQFLPWVLVPRGTYIYHYFASVPFLIMSLSWLAGRLYDRSRKAGLAAGCSLLALAAFFFVLFFPYASGVPVSTSWLDIGKSLLTLSYM